ncbi:MAG: N-acetyltransferase [Parvibaculaceae bacterium]|nr:N-acetyltransferase [Parvibaculaceae bacterium]HBM88680.1 N-acetyltransferase [Rhodobiaceae bacterium]
MVFDILPETPAHETDIEALHDLSFGPGRFAKTAYRMREGVRPVPSLSFVAFTEIEGASRMVGSIRFSPLVIGGDQGLLLGPLAMDPSVRGQGGGLDLMRTALDAARAEGHQFVILVGDAPYYAKVGFKQVPPGKITLPGPVDKSRLLYCELVPGGFDAVSGTVEKGA